MPTRSVDITVWPGVAGPLRAMHSLLERHVSVLARDVLTWRGTWSLVRHEGYDGNLTVMLAACGDLDRSLVVSRSSAGFHLGALDGDEYRDAGNFTTIEALIVAARGRLPPEHGLSHAG